MADSGSQVSQGASGRWEAIDKQREEARMILVIDKQREEARVIVNSSCEHIHEFELTLI